MDNFLRIMYILIFYEYFLIFGLYNFFFLYNIRSSAILHYLLMAYTGYSYNQIYKHVLTMVF